MSDVKDNPSPSAGAVPADPLRGQGLAAFAQQFRDGAMTAEAATRTYLERIRILDRKIGAFRHVDGAMALERARAIDGQRKAGKNLGPLMGVPVAVKEIFRVEGLPFGAGSEIDVSALTPAEGPFVKTLKQQGCVILGVTKTTEFAAATINSGKQAPWNPWDGNVKRVCGGSSHGSASALAAGLCGFSIGSDTGGSVRLPAALCGVVGLKPTMGVWSTDGVFPLSPTFDTVGAFTWSMADMALVFGALAGQTVPAPPSPSTLRLARVTNLFDELDPPVAAATERAIAALTDANVTFVDIPIPEAAEVAAVFGRILAGELVHYLGRERLLKERAMIDPVPWSRIESEIDTDGATLDALRRRHRELIALIGARTAGCDALVCPTTPLSPCPVAEVSEAGAAIEWNRLSGRNTRPGNLFGLCGISLPVHRAGELPVGLQLLAGAGTDSRLLAIATAVEAVVGRGPAPELLQFANRS